MMFGEVSISVTMLPSRAPSDIGIMASRMTTAQIWGGVIGDPPHLAAGRIMPFPTVTREDDPGLRQREAPRGRAGGAWLRSGGRMPALSYRSPAAEAARRRRQRVLALRPEPIVVNAVLRLVPIVVRAPMITTAMSAAIRPYSMAVAPSSLRTNLFARSFIFATV
jgi:hypothetical protein